jgi:putative tryptophan/tyrosine transport system substrate-binding protein
MDGLLSDPFPNSGADWYHALFLASAVSMRRREFITLVGGTAAAWPLAVRAQQSNTVRRVGVLMNYRADEPEGQARVKAFTEGLQKLGWSEGSNLQIDTLWSGSDYDLSRRSAAELVQSAPDVILAGGTANVAALQQVTRSVPIVFGNVVDPVGAGLVASLARPGGNTTGFTAFEYSLAGKWVELLKEIAPNMIKAAVLRDPALGAGIGQFAAIQSTAPSVGVDLSVIDSRDAGEIERAIAAFAGEPNGGLIVTLGSAARHIELITALAIRYRMPSVYGLQYFTASGGLTSYGPDASENFSHAAAYVDRILKGAKPADLPVQTPTKYKLVVNLKTAKLLGLTIPQSVLTRADEVIE